MNRTETWRWSEVALLIVILWLLILIIAVLASRIVPIPFGFELSSAQTDSTDSIAAKGFTTVFTLAENVALAIKDYQQQFLLDIGLMIVGSMGFLYGVALLIYSLIVPTKFRRGMLAVAVGGFNLVFVGMGGLNINDGYLVSDCFHQQNLYISRQYGITEGSVHVSHVEPANGHAKGDVIQVGNASLEVSYYVSACGYKQSIAHGGVLTEGTYARIYYTDYRTILRIDIKNP